MVIKAVFEAALSLIFTKVEQLQKIANRKREVILIKIYVT